MKQFRLAAVCGSLIFVATLQAQPPLQPVADPGFSSPGQTPPAYRDPQPADSSAFDDGSVLQPGKVPHDPQPAAQDELAKYPVWLLIKPDGVQFLQTLEEIACNRNTIPPNAFLLCCVTANFKAAAGEQQPEFQLACDDFLLRGRYGSKQYLEVKGASLNFSTRTQQVQLQGSEELQLELHSIDAVSETRMQADEILLQLNGSPVNETRYVTMSYVDAKTGRERVITKPVVEQIARGTSFQLSAKNITSLETIASPANTTVTDAPKWNPDLPQPGPVQYYDDSSSDTFRGESPQPDNAPRYKDPSSEGFKPVPSRKSRSDLFPEDQ